MINVYATKEDYSKYGSKVLKDEEIEKYLELASIDINRATLTRIEKRGFDNLTSQDIADKLNISNLAFFYLKRTGLTNRII